MQPRHAKLCIVALVGFLTGALMMLDHMQTTSADTPVAAAPSPSAAQVPDVTFTLLDGGSLRLHSLAGHTVLLHFFASWCAPCRLEFSSLLTRMTREDNSTILLAVSGDSVREDAQHFIAPYRSEFKKLFDAHRVIIAYDPNHTIIEGVFQTFKYPETIIITPGLRMERKVIGPMPSAKEK